MAFGKLIEYVPEGAGTAVGDVTGISGWMVQRIGMSTVTGLPVFAITPGSKGRFGATDFLLRSAEGQAGMLHILVKP